MPLNKANYVVRIDNPHLNKDNYWYNFGIVANNREVDTNPDVYYKNKIDVSGYNSVD